MSRSRLEGGSLEEEDNGAKGVWVAGACEWWWKTYKGGVWDVPLLESKGMVVGEVIVVLL